MLPVSLKITTFRFVDSSKADSFTWDISPVKGSLFWGLMRYLSSYRVSLPIPALLRILLYDNLEFLLRCYQRFLSRTVKAFLVHPSWCMWVLNQKITFVKMEPWLTENWLTFLKMSFSEASSLTNSGMLCSITRALIISYPHFCDARMSRAACHNLSGVTSRVSHCLKCHVHCGSLHTPLWKT